MMKSVLKFSRKNLNWLPGNPERWAMCVSMLGWFVCGSGIAALAGAVTGMDQQNVWLTACNAGSACALVPGMLGWLYWRVNHEA